MATTGTEILVVGLDAADSGLVRQLMAEGRMPNVARLAEGGSMVSVPSDEDGTDFDIWPRLISGSLALDVFGFWLWDPQAMETVPFDTAPMKPFWTDLLAAGIDVGLLDVPFAPHQVTESGFSVSGWGPHDDTSAGVRSHPRSVGSIVGHVPDHPFRPRPPIPSHPRDVEGLRRVASAALRGIGMRGELLRELTSRTSPRFVLAVFPELHHAGHYLWHTLGAHGDPDLEVPAIEPSLAGLYQAADAEVGRLIEQVDARVVHVFGMQGMQIARGVPRVLEPVLIDAGYAQPEGARTRSLAGHGRAALASLKRAAPAGLKARYHDRVPIETRLRLAQKTMIPRYDWSRTRAFALPTTGDGFVRINLEGRESQGCVTIAAYDDLCRELEERLLGLRTDAGERVIDHVVRPAVVRDLDPIRNPRPDLIAYWAGGAHHLPTRIADPGVTSLPDAPSRVASHRLEGFLVTSERVPDEQTLAPQDLAGFFTSGLP